VPSHFLDCTEEEEEEGEVEVEVVIYILYCISWLSQEKSKYDIVLCTEPSAAQFIKLPSVYTL